MFSGFTIFLLSVFSVFASDFPEISLTDEMIQDYETQSIGTILSIHEEFFSSTIDLPNDVLPEIIVNFTYYPFETDDPSMENLLNKYVAVVLVHVLDCLIKDDKLSPDELKIIVEKKGQPESHSLFLYEFEDKQETLLMDYSDHIGIIREEFRWERDGEFAMQTRVLRSNVSIIYSLIKKVMTNS
ncbi:hypothetical protein [Spirochaeta isovalerica]|uniref:Uncharacterized protein n=1 Tax=Spirochaeta isovalerica TaxID=150 RepID=A0A841R8A9_9SPIO|nr:hypothetical protein [Spirochaeta isovalerica]MBB6479427.1 hypothetical protein [Spirochaeta isovalerica]